MTNRYLIFSLNQQNSDFLVVRIAQTYVFDILWYALVWSVKWAIPMRQCIAQVRADQIIGVYT